jgi:hypothetical protein
MNKKSHKKFSKFINLLKLDIWVYLKPFKLGKRRFLVENFTINLYRIISKFSKVLRAKKERRLFFQLWERLGQNQKTIF